ELLIRRYEDEHVVDQAPLTVATPTVSTFTYYPSREIVATLKQGTIVTELAERNGYYRITFPDPNDPTRRLMGWAAHFAFEETPGFAPGTKYVVPKCTGLGTMAHVVQDKARCAYTCKDDPECGADGTCEAALELPDNGVVPPTVTYTTVCTPIPGAVVVDAG